MDRQLSIDSLKQKTENMSRLSVVVSTLFWILVFSLLTLSGTSDQEVCLSLAVASLNTIGMIGIFYSSLIISRKCTPRGLVCNIVYIIFTIIALVALSYIFTTVEKWIGSTICATDVSASDGAATDNKNDLMITPIIRTTILFFISYLASVIYYFVRRHAIEETEKKDLDRRRANAELKFLRSQINPHFLFNALNNIYSMVYMGDKCAAEAVLTLSDMLRYVVDNCKDEKILLKDEINYLEKYVRFQKFSYEKGINVVFEKEIQNDHVYVPPMLIQPFIENCFKYSGLGNTKDAFVKISLECDNERLHFHAVNSKSKVKPRASKKREGLGVQNVIKRLELLFPDRHTIDIRDGAEDYEVDMTFTVSLLQNKTA